MHRPAVDLFVARHARGRDNYRSHIGCVEDRAGRVFKHLDAHVGDRLSASTVLGESAELLFEITHRVVVWQFVKHRDGLVWCVVGVRNWCSKRESRGAPFELVRAAPCVLSLVTSSACPASLPP